MKALIALLLLTSLSAFAGELSIGEAIQSATTEPNSRQAEDQAIIKAIISELRKNPFECINIMSQIDFIRILESYTSEEGTINYTETNSSPSITVNIKTSRSHKNTLIFTTSSDLKRIIAISYQSIDYTTIETNIGTLINPIFETNETARRIRYSTTCTLKSVTSSN